MLLAAPLGGEGSDVCARGGDTKRKASQQPLPQLTTTATGRGRAVEHEGREVEEKGTNTALRGKLALPLGTPLFILYDEEDAGGMRPEALPVLPEPQAALPRPTASSGAALS